MPRTDRPRPRPSPKAAAAQGAPAVLGQGLGLALAGLSILAFIGLVSPGGVIAGAVGKAFALLFGRPAWLSVLALMAIGIATFVSAIGAKRLVSAASVVMAAVFMAALSAFTHLVSGLASQPSGPNGGGILGRAVGWNLVLALGYPGAYVVLILMMILGLAVALRPTALSLRLVAGVGRLVIVAILSAVSLARNVAKALEARGAAPSGQQSAPKPRPAPVPALAAPQEKWQQAPLIKIKTSLAGQPHPQDPAVETSLPEKSAGTWRLPPIDLLRRPDRSDHVSEVEIAENAALIESTLASFGVEVQVMEAIPGPVVTQYCLRPAAGVKVARISALSNDLALALSAKSIRIEAPVPGRPFVGLEIPNRNPATVTLRELLESEEYAKLEAPLRILLGKDVADEAKIGTLIAMPHLLIAGSTGAGKSVFLNSLIVSLLCQHSPDELRLILVDPKMVELVTFNDIPHLAMPVVVDPNVVVSVLAWASREMGSRFKMLSEAGHRNVQSFNEEAAAQGRKRLPFIVIVVDELADLMMTAPAEVERHLCRLAQMARAVGIHLVISTQRPSVDVVTGLIKANFPTRVAFMVSSQVDSRTILDYAGAEKLVGRGDMLFAASDSGKLVRIQGAFTSDEEIRAVVKFWVEQGVSERVSSEEIAAAADEVSELDEDLYQDAVAVARQHTFASAALLQRELQVGFKKAQKLIEMLEERGVVGPSMEGRPSREVLPETAFAGEDAL